MNEPAIERALDYIASCADPEKLRQIVTNAHRQGNRMVRDAAWCRLYAVMPAEQPGSLEYDVWQFIYALEDSLSDERGKTIKLSRTRQKIKREREARTVTDLILSPRAQVFTCSLRVTCLN